MRVQAPPRTASSKMVQVANDADTILQVGIQSFPPICLSATESRVPSSYLRSRVSTSPSSGDRRWVDDPLQLTTPVMVQLAFDFSLGTRSAKHVRVYTRVLRTALECTPGRSGHMPLLGGHGRYVAIY